MFFKLVGSIFHVNPLLNHSLAWYWFSNFNFVTGVYYNYIRVLLVDDDLILLASVIYILLYSFRFYVYAYRVQNNNEVICRETTEVVFYLQCSSAMEW